MRLTQETVPRVASSAKAAAGGARQGEIESPPPAACADAYPEESDPCINVSNIQNP